MEIERKKEVINICLDHFIENGLYETSTRSLSKALKLQNAGVYYYFSSKDEAVLQCAEEAALRVEKALIVPTMRDLADPDSMMKQLRARADEMAPTMRFIAAVSGSRRYHDQMKPICEGMTKRYEYYVGQIAASLGCDREKIEPYVYMTIAAVMNYMIFGEIAFAMPQIQVVKDEIKKLGSRAEHT